MYYYAYGLESHGKLRINLEQSILENNGQNSSPTTDPIVLKTSPLQFVGNLFHLFKCGMKIEVILGVFLVISAFETVE